MAPRGKSKTVDVDVSKLRDIEAYTHDDKKRTNNPPVGMAQHDKSEEKVKTYQYDPHIDPSLQWAGKAEGMSFDVPTSSIHIHESIKPHRIINAVQTIGEHYAPEVEQLSFFETPLERMRRRQTAIQFYQHGVDWTNRMIAGDSLVIMNSMLEKEGMAGQVQMVYIDPPYGIKYGSNFQPFVNQNVVKDKDEDLSQEPEMIKAFRDTWDLGIHSYLSYLRNRMLLARELLSESGSIFIQISDTNLHLVRNLCDEIFGVENFEALITFRKTSITFATERLGGVCDYIVWYSKNHSKRKYHQLFIEKELGGVGATNYGFVELINGVRRRLTKEEKANPNIIPKGSRVFSTENLVSSGRTDSCVYSFEFEGKNYEPIKGKSWKTNREGMQRLIDKKRIMALGDDRPYFITYFDEYPITKLTNAWYDTRGEMDLKYVVQTATTIIQRCMLMTSDPGDLVLDITCGSGTTAYVAEQWGRRWITCDTSRVAITLAKQRLMTASFEYYKLAHEQQGVSSGFIYKTVPHTTLGSLANNEPTSPETLYDKPEIDKNKVRITGPFTVEALPAPVVRPLDELDDTDEDMTAKQTDWRDQLRATGILGRGGVRLEFSRVEPMSGTKYLQAEAETKEEEPRRAVICFAGETKPLDSRMVAMAMDEVERLRPAPNWLSLLHSNLTQKLQRTLTSSSIPA